MSKVYAIRRGRIIGKVYSWDECLEATKGYPSAEYKSFKTEVEADAYLRGEELNNAVDNSGKMIKIAKPVSKDVANLFCDGGFKEDKYSFGIYLECANNDYLSCGTFKDVDWVSTGSRNIVGECIGCLAGLQLAGSLGYKRINIYYDYEGLAKWINGNFEAKSEIAIRYVATFNQIVQKYGLGYRFFYTKGHSGVRGNELADKLSTRARKQNIEASAETVWRLQYSVNNAQLQNPRLFL